jgi:hypothetical protein
MNCEVKGCPGQIDMSQKVDLPVGCVGFGSFAYIEASPCNVCRRLHDRKSGLPVKDNAGNKAFYIGGMIINRMPE